MNTYKVIVKGMNNKDLFNDEYKTYKQAQKSRYELYKQGYESILKFCTKGFPKDGDDYNSIKCDGDK